MKEDNIYTAPDPFSIFPMLVLLPVVGNVNDLADMTNAMFARYERVMSMKKKSLGNVAPDEMKKIMTEELMLKNVLDWLSMSLEGKN